MLYRHRTSQWPACHLAAARWRGDCITLSTHVIREVPKAKPRSLMRAGFHFVSVFVWTALWE
jgi:hypothetical protein